jgi:hypothetical protein
LPAIGVRKLGASPATVGITIARASGRISRAYSSGHQPDRANISNRAPHQSPTRLGRPHLATKVGLTSWPGTTPLARWRARDRCRART